MTWRTTTKNWGLASISSANPELQNSFQAIRTVIRFAQQSIDLFHPVFPVIFLSIGRRHIHANAWPI